MEQESAISNTLEPGHIRLVRVVTCTEDLVECEMKQFRLDTIEPWYALSYVWGTEAPEHNVLLNRHQINVKQNLFAALRAIHKAPASDPALPKELWIWIDALSLNQDYDDEKS